MWSAGGGAGTRSIGSGPVQRQQSTPLSQQPQREDMFSAGSGPGRAPSSQNVFRFGNQSNVGGAQSSQAQSSSADDFPPLNRAGGDMGQDRAASLMSALGFNGQSNASTSGQNSRTENGLLNALSANRGGSDAMSPSGMFLSVLKRLGTCVLTTY